MGTKNAAGFTIIEVMLFLAVSGALAIGVLVGSGAAIGQQRYRDSVNSLKSAIQDQYSQVSNVANSRSDTSACSAGNVIQTPGAGASQPRGTSDCLLLGRLIELNGRNLTLSDVVGQRSGSVDSTPVANNDVDELKNYNLSASQINQETKQIEWGATALTPPPAATTASLKMLIARSPISSSVFTFVSTDTPSPSLNQLVNSYFDYAVTDICVARSGGLPNDVQLAVRINQHANSSSAIEIPSESGRVCN